MKRLISVLAGGLLLTTAIAASAAGDRSPSSTSPPITSWQAPAFYTAHSSGRTALTDAAPPVPYIPLVPCRQYDSRSATVLADNTPRTVTLSGAPCGIPASAVAVAVNITVFNIVGAGSNGVFKVGTTSPPTSAWINYPFTETQRANAGVLSTTGTANIIVQVNQGAGSVDFVVDVFGYYGPTPANAANYFTLTNNSGSYTMYLTNLSTSCGGDCGLVSNTNAGNAISGYANQTTPGAFGVGGFSTNYNGVWASSTNQDGLFATGGRDGVFAQGVRYGVIGNSTGASALTYGVIGDISTTNTGSAGVLGRDTSGYTPSTNGGPIGVLGNSQNGFGVLGQSRYISVYGQLRSGTDVNLSFGLLGTTFGTAADSTTGPWAVFAGGTFGATGAKHFVEPHATDPKKVVLYSSLEGREVGTYFRGTASIVNHEAVIVIPEDFRMVTAEEGLTVQVTPIGAYAQVYVESQDLNQIVIRGSRDVQFHYMVNGVRRAFKNFEPVQIGYEFMPQSASDRMPAWLTDEAKARLISNGTYNPDGTVNMTTAERAGFKSIWAEREAATAKAAAANAAAAAAGHQ
jgi:hypothetical protein